MSRCPKTKTINFYSLPKMMIFCAFFSSHFAPSDIKSRSIDSWIDLNNFFVSFFGESQSFSSLFRELFAQCTFLSEIRNWTSLSYSCIKSWVFHEKMKQKKDCQTKGDSILTLKNVNSPFFFFQLFYESLRIVFGRKMCNATRIFRNFFTPRLNGLMVEEIIFLWDIKVLRFEYLGE